jgi:hypothetical protein
MFGVLEDTFALDMDMELIYLLAVSNQRRMNMNAECVPCTNET